LYAFRRFHRFRTSLSDGREALLATATSSGVRPGPI
jgi:hypothetical protein